MSAPLKKNSKLSVNGVPQKRAPGQKQRLLGRSTENGQQTQETDDIIEPATPKEIKKIENGVKERESQERKKSTTGSTRNSSGKESFSLPLLKAGC